MYFANVIYLGNFSFRSYAKRVYQLNTRSRQTRIQSSVSMVEQTVVPVVKSKTTEVSSLIPLLATRVDTFLTFILLFHMRSYILKWLNLSVHLSVIQCLSVQLQLELLILSSTDTALF